MKTIERPTSLLASTGFSSVALLYVSFIWFLFAWQSSIWYVYENSVDLLCGHAYTARFMELSTPNFWAAITTCGSQHRATRGSCVEECVEEDRSRFHGSQHRLSQSVDGVHGEAARAAHMRSAWMSGWGWELFWTLNSAVFKGVERCMKQAVRCFPGSTLAPQLLSSMNLRRMRRASFFLSLLPSTWFVLLFCCGAMSLSALLSSKDERDKLIVARTPKKTVQATDFWLRSFEISGHKNPVSLTAYDRTSAERAVDLSAAIDTKRVAPAPANPPSPLSDITNSPSASGFLFNAGNATFNNVTFNFAPPPSKKRKVSHERLQLKKTRERLLQSRTAEGEFSTAERTTVELSGSTSWSTKKSCF